MKGGRTAWAGLLATAVLALATACAPVDGVSGAAAPASAPSAPAGPFKAQVVGIQWMNPLVRRDYPTEWQLLWTLGLAKPNKDDELVEERPKNFSSVQFVARIVSNRGGTGFFNKVFELYVERMFQPIGRRYAMNGDYFVRRALNIEFEFSTVPALSTANIPADVRITTGGANAGFTSLAAAFDYLEAHPDKTVWVMNWDSPDFPRDDSLAENGVLLVLAGPRFDTEREPLAWIGRPAVRSAQDFETRDGQSRVAQAWRAALGAASDNAGVAPAQLGYVIHDAGAGSEAASARIGRLAQTMTETLPEFDFLAQSFNTAKLLGDMRAGGALTNVALAVAWTHQKGQPVLVAGTHDTGRPTLTVVTPPARPRIVDPERNWFRARGEGNAYLPWWGLRRDADWSRYSQGFSD